MIPRDISVEPLPPRSTYQLIYARPLKIICTSRPTCSLLINQDVWLKVGRSVEPRQILGSAEVTKTVGSAEPNVRYTPVVLTVFYKFICLPNHRNAAK